MAERFAEAQTARLLASAAQFDRLDPR